jgi:hypothetical protein
LEQTTSEKPQHYHHPHPPQSHHPNVHPALSSGMAGTSMARPLSLSLSSPVVPMALAAGGGGSSGNVVTSPVTPTALTSTVVPIQFPPSGKKPAPPPPPRTTSVVTIGHTTPVGQPSGPPPQPVPRSYHHSTTPSDPIEDAKVRQKTRRRFVFLVSFFSSTFTFIYSWIFIFLHLSIDKMGKLFIFHQHDTHLPLGGGWMDGLFVYFIY